MKTHNVLPNPDFLVHWRNASMRFMENIYCAVPAQADPGQPAGNIRTPIATLQASNAHIEVSEVTWTETTTLLFTPHRPGFCLLISSSSSTAIEYGYVDDVVRSSKIGRILFMLPDREINSRSSRGTIRAVTCSFEREYAESIVGPLNHLTPSQLHNSLDVRSPLISSILLRLMNEALYPGPLSDAVVESFGHAMLVECAHWLLVDDSKTDAQGRLTARHFGIIEEYLAGLSGESPSVAALAAACGFSERYFAKLFREQTHNSVAQYIKTVQIAKAKAYLLETDLPLKEIAHRLGFSTPANFSFAFREATGDTPGNFRKTR